MSLLFQSKNPTDGFQLTEISASGRMASADTPPRRIDFVGTIICRSALPNQRGGYNFRWFKAFPKLLVEWDSHGWFFLASFYRLHSYT